MRVDNYSRIIKMLSARRIRRQKNKLFLKKCREKTDIRGGPAHHQSQDSDKYTIAPENITLSITFRSIKFLPLANGDTLIEERDELGRITRSEIIPPAVKVVFHD